MTRGSGRRTGGGKKFLFLSYDSSLHGKYWWNLELIKTQKLGLNDNWEGRKEGVQKKE